MIVSLIKKKPKNPLIHRVRFVMCGHVNITSYNKKKHKCIILNICKYGLNKYNMLSIKNLCSVWLRSTDGCDYGVFVINMAKGSIFLFCCY